MKKNTNAKEHISENLDPNMNLNVSSLTSGQIQFKYETDEAGKLDYAIYNTDGSRLSSNSINVVSGTNTKELNLNVPSGMYILKVRQGKRELTRKFLIQ